ncbi:uncharacterized protein LOC132731379 [Ruditapes philippinarum]|uniref:uncharacterized protein LOC132731379 n=1 Tax=Ruditapes philippinarum TaxID=129788 RepID=UPI00295A7B89|nr:uncharacterized protein LOC132731379 [Ruditapes philippinarum]
MSRVGLKIIFHLLCFCPTSEAELELSPKTVYELLVYETTNLKTELAETKSLVEGIEKKIEQIGSNVSLIANKVDRFVGERSKSLTNGNVKTITNASDAMFQSDFEMQSAVVRKMLINEKTHLRNTLKKFENKIKKFQSDIENRFTLINLKEEMNVDFESKLNDSEAKVSQRISSIDADLQSQLRIISSKQEEQQDTLSDLINATNTRIAAEKDRKVSFSAETTGTQLLYVNKKLPSGNRRVFFRKIIFNHGGGFGRSKTKFTAPKSGTYLFTFDIEPENSGFILMHNKRVLARQTANNKAVIGITYVSAGEKVWVQNNVEGEELKYVAYGRFNGILIN